MSAGHIEREGRVVATGEGLVTVRFERESACDACRAAKVCGGKIPTAELRLAPPSGGALSCGDTVRVGIEEGAALRATALAYLVPLSGFGTAMGAACFAGLPEGGVALASFSGLAAGFALMRCLARRPAFQLQPAVLGIAAALPSPQATGDRPS